MAGQSTISNTFTQVVDQFTFASFHTNENTGGDPPNFEEHQHFLLQDKVVVLDSGSQFSDTLFDNGLTFNTVDNTVTADGDHIITHFNNHVPDFFV
jgi:hypothetical protein